MDSDKTFSERSQMKGIHPTSFIRSWWFFLITMAFSSYHFSQIAVGRSFDLFHPLSSIADSKLSKSFSKFKPFEWLL